MKNNPFPIKELEKQSQYLIGVTDLTEVKAHCFVRDNNYITVDCEATIDDEEFYETIEKLSKYYNADYIKESDVSKIPNITKAISDFLQTEKGKETLITWCYEEDLIDVKLVEELLNFPRKK